MKNYTVYFDYTVSTGQKAFGNITIKAGSAEEARSYVEGTSGNFKNFKISAVR